MNDDTVRHQIFGDQFDTQLVGHFPDDQAGFFIIIGLGQDLAGLHRMADRCEGLDPGHGTGLQSPGVVDQELRVDAEKLIKELFVGQGHWVERVREVPPPICQKSVRGIWSQSRRR